MLPAVLEIVFRRRAYALAIGLGGDGVVASKSWPLVKCARGVLRHVRKALLGTRLCLGEWMSLFCVLFDLTVDP